MYVHTYIFLFTYEKHFMWFLCGHEYVCLYMHIYMSMFLYEKHFLDVLPILN